MEDALPSFAFPKYFAKASGAHIFAPVSTAQEIEEAIRSLPTSERDKLLHHIPDLFPELRGDSEWARIIEDGRSRPALTDLMDELQSQFRKNPGSFPEMTERDFSSPS